MFFKKIEFLFLLSLAYHITKVKSNSYEDQLISGLFKDYDYKCRPSTLYTQSTEINTTIVLNKIIGLDERNQILSTYVAFSLGWHDLRLTWDVTKYNLIYITVPADNVWRPDLVLFNGAEKFDFQAAYQYVRISYFGEIVWVPSGVLKTQCTLNVKYFPFDIQNCSISISTTTFFIDQVDFFVDKDTILDYYFPSNEWTITNTSYSKATITKPFPLAVISFHLIIKRKPLYFVFNLILPCVIILAVAFLSFLIPLQSGEKMSIGITTLLSIIVLLLVIADMLPTTSDSISLISVFYTASTFIIAFICSMSVLTLNIHHYGEQGQPVPMLLQQIFFSKFAKIILFPRRIDINTIRSENIREQSNGINQNTEMTESNNEQLIKNCRNCFTGLFKKKSVSPMNDREENEIDDDTTDKDFYEQQWTMLADIIDRFLFYILFTATLFILLSIINGAPSENLS